MIDNICYNGGNERQEGRMIAKTVPGGKGDLSGKACLLSTFVLEGYVTLIKDRRAVVISAAACIRIVCPASLAIGLSFYLCNIHLPLNRDLWMTVKFSSRGLWSISLGCVLITLVGAAL